jgi:phosphoglycolate phosphatase-like HAD superfamily hydrolase
MKYLLYIFDIDGTLIDSRATITGALYAAGAEFGTPPAKTAEAAAMVGQTLEIILGIMGVPDDRIEWGKNVYRKHYFERIGEEKPYPGIADTVGELSKSVLLSIATNKGKNGATRTLENNGLLKYFDYLACMDNSAAKPDPSSLGQILDFYQSQGKTLKPSDCLVIGDSPFDADYARNAGADFAFAAWGFFRADALSYDPAYIIEHPRDLVSLNEEAVEIEVTPELDLHTFLPRDVKKVTEWYLAEARKKGFASVRIVHGKGRGVQKEIVRGALSKTPFVRKFYDAPAYLGGFGATIAELDV